MSEGIWWAAHMEAIDPFVELSGLGGYFFLPKNQLQKAEPITISLSGFNVNIVKNIMQVRRFALKAPGDC